jgi:hypothetical protein
MPSLIKKYSNSLKATEFGGDTPRLKYFLTLTAQSPKKLMV